MGAVCARYSWTCRPLWSLFIILATVSCTSRCSESPAAAKGKMYPRGNHWAVGHLMGKKSIERLPDPPETSSGHLMPPDVAGATEPDRYQGLLEALVLQQNHGNTVSRAADWLRGQRSGWREEERDKYLREMSHLLLWALKMQDGDSA